MKKVQKMLQIGLLTAFFSLGISVQAATHEDEVMPTGSACMINVNNSKYIEKINVQYIRNIYIEKSDPNIIWIELASNYYNKRTHDINYPSHQEALKGLETISDNIHNCRIKAQSIQNTSTKTIK